MENMTNFKRTPSGIYNTCRGVKRDVPNVKTDGKISAPFNILMFRELISRKFGT